MHEAHASLFRHPRTGEALALRVDEERDGQVITGALSGDGDEFRVVRGIPRFCPESNYAESFGYQWQYYSTTQLDSKARWGAESRRRLFTESAWPERMDGERILEAGCGMGRFTEVLATTGAEICTFDYSAAVDANFENNGRFPNLCFAQANVYDPPYEPASFDRVMCIGVLQHCPSPKDAFMSLTRFVKPGGHLFIDVYRLHWKSLLLGKYYLRPVTRLMRPETLHRFVRAHVGLVYPFTGSLRKLIGARARSISWLLGMADYRGVFDVPEATLREFSLLDTFDELAPAYDRPKTIGTVRHWFEEAGFTDVHVGPGTNGVTARARRPRR